MKTKIWKGFWTVKDVQKNKNCLFVYGDNDIHEGCSGQAIIRNEKNTVGIPTKKLPSLSEKSFYTDDEYQENKIKIKKAIIKMINKMEKYDILVFPENGLGTGLAQLDKRAPKTYKYLVEKIKQIKRAIKNN